LNKIKKHLYKFLEAFGGILTILMFILLIGQVIVRSTDFVIPWTENLARVTEIWLTFIGAAVVQFEKDHIKAEFIPDLIREFNEKVYIVYEIFIDIFILLFSIIVIMGAIQMYQTMSYMGLAALPDFKVSWLYLAQIIGIGALALFVLFDIIESVQSVITFEKNIESR